jgi:ribosomal protein S18 acetylase RimI-like enzyme
MIVELCFDHVSEVSELHLAHLTTPFRARPGKELLRLYYQSLCRSKGGCGFVAQEGSKMLGYVCGIWDASTVKRELLKRSWLRLTCWGLLQGILEPAAMAHLLSRFGRSAARCDQRHTGYELRPIVVVPEARGTGLAQELLRTLLKDAARRGFDEVDLYAERDNVAAIKWYQKSGFQFLGEEIRSHRVYLRYSHVTGGTP